MTKLLHNIAAAYVAVCLAMLSFPLQVFALPSEEGSQDQYVETFGIEEALDVNAEALLQPCANNEFAFHVIPTKAAYSVGDSVHLDFKYENVDSLIDPNDPLAEKTPQVLHTLYSFYRTTNGETVEVVSPGMSGGLTAASSFEYPLMVAGEYRVRFLVQVQTPTGEYENGIPQSKVWYSARTEEIKFTVTDDGAVTAAQVVSEVVAECLSKGFKTDYEKALWLHDWLVKECSYQLNYMDVDGMFVGKKGNCEAYHGAYARLLKEVGIESARVSSPLPDNHAWSAVKLDGKWYQVDVTWDDPAYQLPDEYPNLNYLYFGLTDEIMALVHRAYAGPASGYESTSLDNNYFIKTGKIKQWSDPYKAIIQEAIAKHETSVSMRPLNKDWDVTKNYARVVINSLIAYQLNNESWSNGNDKVSVKVTYNPGERDLDNAFLADKPDSLTISLNYTDTKPTTPTTPTKPTTPPTPQTPTVQKITMYRLYNPNSGEHFYTASTAERDNLSRVGWKYEGAAWTAPDKGDPVYRLYNPNAGDHHYTLSTVERDMLVRVGWKYEGVGWYSAGANGLYRLYNPNAIAGAHHYTTSVEERNMLVKAGWKYEGVGWCGL